MGEKTQGEQQRDSSVSIKSLQRGGSQFRAVRRSHPFPGISCSSLLLSTGIFSKSSPLSKAALGSCSSSLERQNLSPGCALRWQEVDGCQFRLWWRIPGNDVWNNRLGMRHQGEEVMERMGTFPLQSDSSFQICV